LKQAGIKELSAPRSSKYKGPRICRHHPAAEGRGGGQGGKKRGNMGGRKCIEGKAVGTIISMEGKPRENACQPELRKTIISYSPRGKRDRGGLLPRGGRRAKKTWLDCPAGTGAMQTKKRNLGKNGFQKRIASDISAE